LIKEKKGRKDRQKIKRREMKRKEIAKIQALSGKEFVSLIRMLLTFVKQMLRKRVSLATYRWIKRRHK
jgi:aspartate carbamoyltransferase regulatory subunit